MVHPPAIPATWLTSIQNASEMSIIITPGHRLHEGAFDTTITALQWQDLYQRLQVAPHWGQRYHSSYYQSTRGDECLRTNEKGQSRALRVATYDSQVHPSWHLQLVRETDIELSATGLGATYSLLTDSPPQVHIHRFVFAQTNPSLNVKIILEATTRITETPLSKEALMSHSAAKTGGLSLTGHKPPYLRVFMVLGSVAPGDQQDGRLAPYFELLSSACNPKHPVTPT